MKNPRRNFRNFTAELFEQIHYNIDKTLIKNHRIFIMNHIDRKELNEWISLINELDDMQKLTLIGLLEKFPDLKPNTIKKDKIIGEEKVFRTERYFERKLRKILRFYCRLKSQHLSPDDLLSQFISYLIGAMGGLSLGAATGFAIWLLHCSTKKWCDKYSPKSFAGTGGWTGFDIGVLTVNGVYNLIYNPSISTIVRTKQLNLRVPKLKIFAPSTIQGVFSTGHINLSNRDANVEFTDVNNNCIISGIAEDVTDDDGKKIFSGFNFEKTDLNTNVTTQLS